MYFCEDADLLAWEPAIFTDATFAHQAIVKEAAGTLTGTSLVMAAGVLGAVAAGMVAMVALADGTVSQLVEVVSVADASHATVSALRGRSTEPGIPPLVSGAVKVTVVTFRPQIAAVGDSLLEMLGVASSRGTEPAPAFAATTGFKPAAVFGVLATLFRAMSSADDASVVTLAKRTFYEGLAQAARQTISAMVDRNGDGVPETRVWGGVREMARV